MPFVRTKKNQGKIYYQYVESIKIDGKPRQKVLEHIGKVVPNKEQLRKLEFKYTEKKIQQIIRSGIKFKPYKITQEDIDYAQELKEIFHKNIQTLSKKGKEELVSRFKTRYTCHSCSLEGNTITLAQTSQIINKKESIAGKKLIEIQEIRNHQEAIEYMMLENADISEEFIKKLHGILTKDIKKLIEDEDPSYLEGEYRTDQRFVDGAEFIPTSPDQIEKEMKKLIQFYKRNKYLIHPLELACEFHLRFIIIHPFSDGNGRMARLLSNYILDRSDYPMIDISVKNREEYISSLAKGIDENPENSKYLSTFSLTELKNYLEELRFT